MQRYVSDAPNCRSVYVSLWRADHFGMVRKVMADRTLAILCTLTFVPYKADRASFLVQPLADMCDAHYVVGAADSWGWSLERFWQNLPCTSSIDSAKPTRYLHRITDQYWCHKQYLPLFHLSKFYQLFWQFFLQCHWSNGKRRDENSLERNHEMQQAASCHLDAMVWRRVSKITIFSARHNIPL